MAIGDFVGKFGSFGTGDGQFYIPQGLDADENYIYNFDDTVPNSSKKIQIFNVNSPYNFIDKKVVDGSDFPQANYKGLKVDANYMYLFNGYVRIYNKISPYTFIGKSAQQILGTINFNGLDIDNSYIYQTIGAIGAPAYGTIYIINKNSPFNTISTFTITSDINYLAACCAVDDNYIYVTENEPGIDARVKIFDKNSPYSLIGSFGSFGTGDGQFDLAVGIEVDDLYIYISDLRYSTARSNRIQYFSKTSPYTFIGKWGTTGTGNGQFSHPTYISIKNDLLYVTDRDNYRIQIFNSNPAFIPGARGGGGSGGGASGKRLLHRDLQRRHRNQ